MIGQEQVRARRSVAPGSSTGGSQPWQRPYNEPLGPYVPTRPSSSVVFPFRSAVLTVAPLLGDSATTREAQAQTARATRVTLSAPAARVVPGGVAAGRIRAELVAPTARIVLGRSTASDYKPHALPTVQHESNVSEWRSGNALHSTMWSQFSQERALGHPGHLAPGRSDATTTPYLSLVWQLVEREQLTAARQLLASVKDDPALRRIRQLVNRPATSLSPRKSTDRTADYGWLTRHGHDYSGQWVAVVDGELVAAAPTLRALRQRLKKISPPSPPLLHRV